MSRIVRAPLEPLQAGVVVLDEGLSRYLVKVHRLREGATFIAFDSGAKLEAQATLLTANARAARAEIGPLRAAERVSPFSIRLLQGFGKGDKLDQVVRDATVLGVTTLVAVETERSVVRLGERAESRQQRWRAISVEAARQSGRGDRLEVFGPEPLRQALAQVEPSAVRLCLHPEASLELYAALDAWQPSAPVALLIGPEGGFSDAELELASDHGFRAVRFGRFVLRTETAATAVLGAMVARGEAGLSSSA